MRKIESLLYLRRNILLLGGYLADGFLVLLLLNRHIIGKSLLIGDGRLIIFNIKRILWQRKLSAFYEILKGILLKDYHIS